MSMPGPAHSPAGGGLDAFLIYARVTMAQLYPRRSLEAISLTFQGEPQPMHLFVPAAPEEKRVTSHSPDFRAVVWYGKQYTFTALQAAVVAILWTAWEAGSPDVGQACLLEEAGSESGKLLDLFRGHPVIEDGVIARNGRAVWRLWEPEE